MKVAVRTDASIQMGTGHVMRCLTLADALKQEGATVEFVCRDHDGHLGGVISQKGYNVHLLSSGSSHQEDPGPTKAILRAMGKPDWLIVDHYGLGLGWEAAVNAFAHRSMVIDDLANRQHLCDLLLDQNLVQNMHSRYNGLVPQSCRCLLGPAYALLHPVYNRVRARVMPREGVIRKILIFFGGADTYGLTHTFLCAFSRVSHTGIEIDVVMGINNQKIGEIRELAMKYENVHCHVNLAHLAGLMAEADLAVGACGSAAWERLCLGLPSLVVSFGDDQQPIAKELHAKGLIHWLGHCDAVDGKKMRNEVGKIIRQNLNREWSRRCMAVVDGLGVHRVRDMIMQMG